MSSTGAMIDAPEVPEAGCAVRLVRGGLAVPADVVWSAERRCGLRFAVPACVKEWLAPSINQEQQRIDDSVRLLKAGAIPLPVATDASASPGPNELGHDLRDMMRLISLLSDELSTDEEVISSHGQGLQSLDIVQQTLDAVAKLLIGDSDERTTLTRLSNLRMACNQALQRASRH